MGTLRKRLIGPLLCLAALSVVVYFVVFFLSPSKDTDERDESGHPGSYYIEDTVPPKLADYFLDTFEECGWSEVSSLADASITVTRDTSDREPDEKTTEQIGTDETLDLFQVWVAVRPFEAIFDDSENATFSISPFIDAISGPELSVEFWAQNSILVSPETNAFIPAFSLTTLEEVGPFYTVVPFEGINPLTPDAWTDDSYPLVTHTTVSAPEEYFEQIQTKLSEETFLEDNHYRTSLPKPEDFVTIVKTGTTVTGGPGWELCERVKGRIDYPIDDVKSELSSADITIISNETSFLEGCSQPAGTTAFCGKPAYLQNILDLGVDLVSLTGNHMCDYGKATFNQMLSTYTQNDIQYFGGGVNTSQAWTPAYVETNAGTIAFLGYNLMGPDGVIATEESPGAAYYDREAFTAAMEEAAAEADIIWVDTHLWPEYGTTPTQDQISLTTEAVDLGADIVTGVSSHEILGMTFYKEKPVFYGLGNFLFDQMWSTETRQGMVVKITAFEGKIRQIDLLPTVMYDYCQPRFATGSEKDALLRYFLDISSFPAQ